MQRGEYSAWHKRENVLSYLANQLHEEKTIVCNMNVLDVMNMNPSADKASRTELFRDMYAKKASSETPTYR